jgi:hypothetical protein
MHDAAVAIEATGLYQRVHVLKQQVTPQPLIAKGQRAMLVFVCRHRAV